MGLGKIKEKDGREKRERERKIFTVDQGQSRRVMALSYPVTLKPGKSCLRRLRPCERWK